MDLPHHQHQPPQHQRLGQQYRQHHHQPLCQAPTPGRCCLVARVARTVRDVLLAETIQANTETTSNVTSGFTVTFALKLKISVPRAISISSLSTATNTAETAAIFRDWKLGNYVGYPTDLLLPLAGSCAPHHLLPRPRQPRRQVPHQLRQRQPRRPQRQPRRPQRQP
jgi:hypothetical protein